MFRHTVLVTDLHCLNKHCLFRKVTEMQDIWNYTSCILQKQNNISVLCDSDITIQIVAYVTEVRSGHLAFIKKKHIGNYITYFMVGLYIAILYYAIFKDIVIYLKQSHKDKMQQVNEVNDQRK